MNTNESYTLQERVETLVLNLSMGRSLYTTPKGRKAYAHSLLVEIQSVILYVNAAIDVIQSNTELFPVAPIFYMNFSTLKNEVKNALKEQRNNPCLNEQHFKALKELSARLEEARSKLNGPDLCQMVSCYKKVWGHFFTMKWPSMLHEVEVQTLAGMPPSPASRRRILSHATHETLTVAQRQERQLTLSDTLWQQLSIRFDDLVVEWLADSLPVEGSPQPKVRLKAARAEVSHEERSSATLAARVQHSDTVSQQQEEASVAGMVAVESQACRGAGTPRQRLWLWLLPWLVLFLCAGFFLLKKRFGWPP